MRRQAVAQLVRCAASYNSLSACSSKAVTCLAASSLSQQSSSLALTSQRLVSFGGLAPFTSAMVGKQQQQQQQSCQVSTNAMSTLSTASATGSSAPSAAGQSGILEATGEGEDDDANLSRTISQSLSRDSSSSNQEEELLYILPRHQRKQRPLHADESRFLWRRAEELARLRSLPRLRVGKSGPGRGFLVAVGDALEVHELVRVEVPATSGVDTEFVMFLLESTQDCTLVKRKGHTLTVFRDASLPRPLVSKGHAVGGGLLPPVPPVTLPKTFGAPGGGSDAAWRPWQAAVVAGVPEVALGQQQQQPAAVMHRHQQHQSRQQGTLRLHAPPAATAAAAAAPIELMPDAVLSPAGSRAALAAAAAAEDAGQQQPGGTPAPRRGARRQRQQLHVLQQQEPPVLVAAAPDADGSGGAPKLPRPATRLLMHLRLSKTTSPTARLKLAARLRQQRAEAAAAADAAGSA